MSATAFFDAARAYRRELTGNRLDGLSQEDVDALNAATIGRWSPSGAEVAHDGTLTAKMAMELVGHEAIVQEAYKDSVGVWTWSVGITSASGHSVERYKDNPQAIERCLEVFVWVVRTNYLPDVLAAFGGRALTEAQLSAALSFHYNTGTIKRASWVKKWLTGDIAGAKSSFMEWRNPPEIIGRRQDERDLFFDGKWSQDGKATIYEVAKPSYSPKWSSARRVDISAALAEAMGAGA